MKKYFEYEFNDHIKERLLDYYSSKDGVRDFGNENGRRKTLLKLKRIEKYISFSSDDYICDIGCSDGSLLNCLKGKYKRATGLDISEEAIKKCKKNADQNVNFKAYNGSTIQSDILFDKIFAMDVLEHAFEPDELVSSIYKNLAWGGGICYTGSVYRMVVRIDFWKISLWPFKIL
ncbi:MAG: class I SAM-dependent methyltransferase [Lachnospiraceae bacterium]|nr:class I SAM-dependent methyltransferase [Lachnospiraceae bacterium]MCI8749220.1 class I SAM-dependent methyltransferase [Lachnospiraceae bacterium]